MDHQEARQLATATSQTETPIQQFYNGATVFVTGGTGFVGKTLIEKLLRSCPGLKSVYLLVRAKKGKDANQRVEELCNDPIFDLLRKEDTMFAQKIVPIVGDCSLPGIGLTEMDKQKMIDNVNVIFHAAATVRFDEKIRIAMNINVYAARDLLDLSKKMANLKAFVHVSTAYSHATAKHVDEQYYECANIETIKALTDKYTDEQLEEMMPEILGKWKNTYTLTKAMAEEMVRGAQDQLPVVLFRPGIVIGVAKEPVKGWIDNLYGPTGVVVGCGAGLLRAMILDKDSLSNLIPVDYTVNAIIASAWDIQEKNLKREPIYNYISNARRPLKWGDYLERSFDHGKEVPSMRAIWYNFLLCTKQRWLYYFYSFFLHIVPALFMDTALLVRGKKMKMLQIYKKIHKYLEVIAYFSTHEWIFTDDNVQALIGKMSPEDRETFYCDMEDVEWEQYIKDHLKGIRIYLFKEDPATIPAAAERMKKLKMAHRTLQLFFITATLYVFYYILSSILRILI